MYVYSFKYLILIFLDILMYKINHENLEYVVCIDIIKRQRSMEKRTYYGDMFFIYAERVVIKYHYYVLMIIKLNIIVGSFEMKYV